MQNSVVKWLEETAEKYPDRTAFADENHTYKWAEFRHTALSIALNIERVLPGRKHPVAVYMKKSADMLAVYLGIAYSGNFYCPVDVEMPAARTAKILSTLQPALMITTRELSAEVRSGGHMDYSGDVLCFENIISDEVDDKKAFEFSDSILDTDLLHVLFTSGSTGTPKGVAVTHHAVIDTVDWLTEEFSITAEDSFGNQSPLYFDNSVLDIYTAVKTGAACYIIPETLFSQPVKLLRYLAEHEITTIFWVPSAMIMVSGLKAFRNVDISKTLKRVLFCGEVMPNRHLNIWRRYLPDVLYANLYGTTETLILCTYYIADREFEDDEPLPIGKPIRNTEIMLLDEEDRTVTEPDSIGELCLRSSSMAVGYYNDPQRTAESFVQNPMQEAYEEKIYRTGDLAKYNDRHELVYVCRKDFQIKHLGHRIELGEIETAVSSLDEIDVCCCLYDQKKSRIVLFVETEDSDIDRHYIADRLSQMIPDYMIPGRVIRLDSMPHNQNGKIDRIVLKEKYL